jgi:hypothetical protein
MLLLSSTLLFTHPTSTTLFPVLSKLTASVLSFEDLMDNSNISFKYSDGLDMHLETTLLDSCYIETTSKW